MLFLTHDNSVFNNLKIILTFKLRMESKQIEKNEIKDIKLDTIQIKTMKSDNLDK